MPEIARQHDAAFERWYLAYPRHVAKGAARNAFRKAAGKTSAEGLIEAAGRYADRVTTAHTEARFIPHPATWLNQERWADEERQAQATDSGALQDDERILVANIRRLLNKGAFPDSCPPPSSWSTTVRGALNGTAAQAEAAWEKWLRGKTRPERGLYLQQHGAIETYKTLY